MKGLEGNPEHSGLKDEKGIRKEDRRGAGSEVGREPSSQVKEMNTKACGQGLRGAA